MEDILVSIVIPTKNRYCTLFPLISSLKQICERHSDLEVVVQDNSDDNSDATGFFEQLHTSNIKYFYEDKWLSVGDNSDLAILHSTGEYISFIGDDDAFTDDILKVAVYMKKFDYEACNCNYALYRWPSAILKDKCCLEYIGRGKSTYSPNIENELRNVMRGGMQSKRNLPGVYHGLVKRSSLDQVYAKTGTFFPGPSPDMANAVALSLVVRRFIITSIPFIIDGYSKASTGHLSETKKHIGNLDEQSFLPKDTIDNWTERIPKVWLPNTIWPESAIQALRRMSREDLMQNIDFTAMYIKISKSYPQCKSLCDEYIAKYSNRHDFLRSYCRVALVYLKNRLHNRIDSLPSKSNLRIKREIAVSKAIEEISRWIYNNRMLEQLYGKDDTVIS